MQFIKYIMLTFVMQLFVHIKHKIFYDFCFTSLYRKKSNLRYTGTYTSTFFK